MKNPLKWWKVSFWLLMATVLFPAVLSVSVGILILVFYRESWDVAFGVLVLCFAVFAIVGSSVTVGLLARTSRLSRMQSEFISRISHDFRTPLTAIRLFVDTIRSGKVSDPEEQERCLDLLAKETDRMERLVEQVLTWRHMQQSRLVGNAHPVSAEELVDESVAPLLLEERHRARLQVMVEPALPQTIVDKDAVVEALRNIVENGLKYTSGMVVVSARAERAGLALAVRDQGPPIPRRERKRIFKRFYRGGDGTISGTGLGLAIARHVARNHGGSLGLEIVGDHNVFTLALPVVAIPTRRVDKEGYTSQDSEEGLSLGPTADPGGQA